MDTLPDSEIKEIWKRIKQYIDPNQIKAETREQFVKELRSSMNAAGEPSDKSGSMKTLVKKGFAERASAIPGLMQSLPGFAPKKPVKVIEPIPGLPSNIRPISGERYAIKTTTKGTKRQKITNVKIISGKWKGRKAFWIYNTRIKKLVTWGLPSQEKWARRVVK